MSYRPAQQIVKLDLETTALWFWSRPALGCRILRLAAEPKRWMSVTAPVLPFGALESGLWDEKCGNDPVDDLQDGREQLGMCSEQQANRDRKREHPLAHRHPGDDVIDQVGGGLRHAPGATAVAHLVKMTPLFGTSG